ncbi:MAG: putative ef hand family protein [Streblomastix strix]|uniref:Putative ef hand family protein n=1 Tax=Streblomastix strix TaxID=222440 RepID=A0A5J4WID3_9EUKA|nr:MAG: putative ef hand family protein [Streblomastix strix]
MHFANPLRRRIFDLDKDELMKLQGQIMKDGGVGGIDLPQFVELIGKQVYGKEKLEVDEVSQVQEFFLQVDTKCKGKIQWSDISGYLTTLGPLYEQMNNDDLPKYIPISQKYENVFDRQVNGIIHVPNLKHVITYHNDGRIKFWDSNNWSLYKTLEAHQSDITAVEYLNEQQMLVTASNDRTIKFWIRTRAVGVSERLAAAATSANVPKPKFGQEAQFADIKLLFDFEDQKYKGKRDDEGWYEQKSILFSGGQDNNIHIWDIEKLSNADVQFTQPPNDDDNKENGMNRNAHDDWIMSLKVIPEIGGIASASLDKTIKLWDIDQNSLINTLRGHTIGISSLTYSPLNRMIISGGAERDIYLWSVFMNKPIEKLRGHSFSILSLRMLNEGTDTGGICKLWDMRMMRCIQTLNAGLMEETEAGSEKIKPIDKQREDVTIMGGFVPESSFTAICVNQQNEQIITSGHKKFCVWNTEKSVNAGKACEKAATEIIFNSRFSSFIIASGSEISIWNSKDGQLERRINTNNLEYRINKSEAEKQLKQMEQDMEKLEKKVKKKKGKWEMERTKEQRGIKKLDITTMILADDGKRIILGMNMGWIKSIDYLTARCLQQGKVGENDVDSLFFLDRIRCIAVYSGDKNGITIWDLSTAQDQGKLIKIRSLKPPVGFITKGLSVAVHSNRIIA